MTAERFRKKPIVIEAIRWDGDNLDEIAEWITTNGGRCRPQGRLLYIDTLEGSMAASVGDMVIRGVQGEFYPCKPDIFDATYELLA